MINTNAHNAPMWLILVESLLALVVFVAIVAWVLRSKRPEPPSDDQ